MPQNREYSVQITVVISIICSNVSKSESLTGVNGAQFENFHFLAIKIFAKQIEEAQISVISIQ